jgi:hypothetical protein
MLKLKGESTTNRMTKLLLWSRLLAFSKKTIHRQDTIGLQVP